MKGILHSVEQVRTTMLPVERLAETMSCLYSQLRWPTHPRNHRMDGSQVGFAVRTPIDAFAGQIASIAHAHDWMLQRA